jgi:NADH-quinone oxidoreductase subunit G
MTKTVRIIIDDVEYEVPAGANLVDAAKGIGNDVPVFCYHPKLAPVGMCRMCLVELGALERSRETGEIVLDENGRAKVRWFPKLQTACTQIVSDGMVVRTNTSQVEEARENMLEFLLTSHPLDCPICDKGGECPLQNLTMAHGPGVSRMNFDDKIKLDKHVPLGDLIFLDEERCIQCARCIRFQDEIVGDDVLAFHERGRTLQIITHSDPGFDSYFSGNTTDICPVGALTTTDFRFGARPWELTNIPSICPHDAAGSNITLCTRLDRDHGGRAIIKRVMPRQNEYVNEIWISDKTRFGHHFTRSADRLEHPVIEGSSAAWNEALTRVADALKAAEGDIAVIAGSGLSTEDMWALRQLAGGLGSDRLGAWPPTHAGADLVAQVGVGLDTNLGRLGRGDAVLVIASDLEEEVPIWRLRIKQAYDRGAYLVVANARHTRLADFASERVLYETGQAAHWLDAIEKDAPDVAKKLAEAENLIIVTGAEGLNLAGSRALMQAAANFLIKTGHVGKPQNGLLSAFPGPNGMGLHYMGYSPEATQAIIDNPPKVLLVAQADVMFDDPQAAAWLDKVETLISLSLFEDGAALRSFAALPIQSFAERDGTFISGERRVQRFYTAQGPIGQALPAWQIASRLGEMLGQGRVKMSAAAVMLEISRTLPEFENMRYKELAHTERQFPIIGDDVYYGGTAYQNNGGLGVQIATAADRGEQVSAGAVELPDVPKAGRGKLLVVPVTRLYNRERVFQPSVDDVLHPRVPDPYVALSSADARKLEIGSGDLVEISAGGVVVQVQTRISDGVPAGTVILPRHLTTTAVPTVPVVGEISKIREAVTVKG